MLVSTQELPFEIGGVNGPIGWLNIVSNCLWGIHIHTAFEHGVVYKNGHFEKKNYVFPHIPSQKISWLE